MKEGQKRIKNDDFQQVEKCNICGDLFWAKSEYELGNWQRECEACREKRKFEQEKRDKQIRENGEKFLRDGQIYAWKLGEDILFNDEWELNPPEREFEINLTNIDDKVRELRKNGSKSITWHPYCFSVLLEFMKRNGFGVCPDSTFVFMGVEHYEGERGDYEYVLNPSPTYKNK